MDRRAAWWQNWGRSWVEHGADLYECGHDHDQQLLAPRNGVHCVVSGAGSKSRNVRWKDDTIYAATNFGFARFQVSKTELLIEFVNNDGVVGFAYKISAKGPRPF